ncbi:MAG: hypothetical protein AAF989_04720 [Planctomycetota bacterium]
MESLPPNDGPLGSQGLSETLPVIPSPGIPSPQPLKNLRTSGDWPGLNDVQVAPVPSEWPNQGHLPQLQPLPLDDGPVMTPEPLPAADDGRFAPRSDSPGSLIEL